MSAAGADNANVDSSNIIFTIRHKIICSCSNVISKRLAKDLKDQFIGMNIKQKVKIKIRQMSLDIFLNQILLESIDYLF